jgi:hypothetical protein
MIQVIEKQGHIWHMIIHGENVLFSRNIKLYINGVISLQPNVDNGLRWRINRKWVSYNQIKKAIYDSNAGTLGTFQ